MKQRKAFISRKLEDGKVMNVEVIDVGQEDLVLLTVSIFWPEDRSDRNGIPWVSAAEEVDFFFESMPQRWISSEVSDEMAKLQVDLFTKQLGHSDQD